MVNRVTLVGNLGDDPEVRYLPQGTPVVYFSLATNETRRNKDSGEKETITEWHRIKMYGRLAEIAEEFLSTGKQVYLEGKNKTRSYEADDGSKRYVTEVVCHEMKMLGGGSGSKGTDVIPDEVDEESCIDNDEKDKKKKDKVPF